jgi:hypothetical protein
MKNQDFITTFTVDQSQEEVFAAINNVPIQRRSPQHAEDH